MVLLLILLGCLVYESQGDTCRAVALEGGGSRGAYEAGVLYALANSSKAGNIQWNVVSGISIGALNSGIVCQYPMGEELAMSEYLVAFWSSYTSNDQVYIEWPGGLVAGLLFHGGLYDNSPSVERGRETYNKPIKRNITVGSTNFDTGLYGTFNESLGLDLLDGLLCSSSPPFFIAPHTFQGYTWADGGCIMNMDAVAGILRCLDVTDNQSDITIDLIYDDPYVPLPPETSFKTLDVFQRAYRIRNFDSTAWFYYASTLAYPDVNFRYILQPSEEIPGGAVPLNFTQPNIQMEISLGIKDVNTLLDNYIDGKTIIKNVYSRVKNRIIYP